MGKKFLFLELIPRPGKLPTVYIWTHHGEGLQAEWRGSIVQPRSRSVIHWLRYLFSNCYGKHHRAYTRARARRERAVKEYGPREAIKQMVLLQEEKKRERDHSTDET